MSYLDQKIDELTSLYNSVLDELNQMTEETFDEHLASAKNYAISADNCKKEIFDNFDKKLLEKYTESLSDLTKQIQTSYDNIVAEKQKQISAAASELKNLQNKKKMAVYER